VLERQDLSLALNAIVFVTRLLSLWVGGLLRNPRMALALFALSGTLTYGYLATRIMAMAGVPWRRIGSVLGRALLRFIPAGVVLILLKVFHALPWVITAVAAVLLGAYYAFEIGRDPQLRRLVRSMRT